MQSTGFGFALGFFLISLGIPLECCYPEPRIVSFNEPDERNSGRQNTEGQEKKGSAPDVRWIVPNFIRDLWCTPSGLRAEFRGYRRITPQNVLDHPIRRKIYALICENPGIDLHNLARNSGCNENTIRYHVDRIAEEKWITIFYQGKSDHFFENHNTYSEDAQLFLARYASGLTGRILKVIRHSPGITRKDLADQLGIAGPTVTRAVQDLAHEGSIRLEKKGKFTRHYLSNESLSLIQQIKSA